MWRFEIFDQPAVVLLQQGAVQCGNFTTSLLVKSCHLILFIL